MAPLEDLGPLVRDPSTGHGYRASKTRVSIDEALELARLAGGYLVSFERPEEEEWVRERFGSERTWLGLEFPHETWASGASVGATHWNEREPSHGDREPFVLFNWVTETGAWNDVTGGAEDRFFALIELEDPADDREVSLPVRPAPTGKGVLLLVIDGLTDPDLEDPSNANLHGFASGSARTASGCAPGGGLECGWAMLEWGVGPGKSEFDQEDPRTHYWFDTLQARLENTWPEATSGWIVDDVDLTRKLASNEKLDVRVPEPGAWPSSRRAHAVADALALPTPAVLTVGWRNGLEGATADRKKVLAQIDLEVGAVLTLLHQRPSFPDEDWLVVLTSPGISRSVLESASSRKKDQQSLLVVEVPLLFRGGGFEPGVLAYTVGLGDVFPTAARHLGLPVSRTWWLDGLALQSRTAVAFDKNALVNGDAESQFGWSRLHDWLVPGWRCDGTVGTDVYRQSTLASNSEGPPTRGRCYFAGSAVSEARMEQIIDVSPLSGEIDEKGVEVTFSGWLGGHGDQDHRASLQLECLDALGKPLGRPSVSEVGRSERRRAFGAEKGMVRSGLIKQELRKKVPPRTRRIRVTLCFTGSGSCQNACADDLQLVLRRQP